MFEYNTQ